MKAEAVSPPQSPQSGAFLAQDYSRGQSWVGRQNGRFTMEEGNKKLPQAASHLERWLIDE